MIKNRKGASSEVSRQAFVILPIAILILLSLIFIFAKGVGSPWNKTTSCESQNGIWSKAGCEITVSSPYSLANNKGHKKETCCIPASGKQKEFDVWKKTVAVTGGGEKGDIKGSDTVSLDIGGETLLVGNTIKVEADSVSVQVVKNMKEGDFCVISISAAKNVGGSIVTDESGNSFSPVKYDSCVKGKVLDYGKKTFSKGLYIIKVEVYDKLSETEYGPYISYIDVTTSEVTKSANTNSTTDSDNSTTKSA